MVHHGISELDFLIEGGQTYRFSFTGLEVIYWDLVYNVNISIFDTKVDL